MWPDQTPRHERQQAALAVAHEHGTVDIRRGDALGLLPGVIESAPAGALVCVFHTAVLIYFTHEQRQALEGLLAAAGRDVAWVAGEMPGLVVPGRVLTGVVLGQPATQLVSECRLGGREREVHAR